MQTSGHRCSLDTVPNLTVMSTDVSVRRGRIELQQAKNQSRRPQPYQKPAHATQTLSDLEETQLRCTCCRLCMCLACSGSWCQPAFTPGHWPDEAQHSTTAKCRVQTLTLVFLLSLTYPLILFLRWFLPTQQISRWKDKPACPSPTAET